MNPRPTGERDPAAVPELVVLNGVAAGTVFVLGDVPAVVGRSPEAHLQIGDPWISSMHAMFERRADGVWVVDLESRNGVFLGEDRVGEACLKEGTVVRLGRTEVRFTLLHAGTAEFARVRPDAPPPRRETARTDGTLSTHLPLVREREADPRALALRTATVLRMALDARGLDSAPASPERVRSALDAAASAALAEGAVVARLAGVGVLALFGLDGPGPQDAGAALRAARAARADVRSQGALELRAAVESGPVLAGDAGVGGGFELTALGPAAQRAERLLAMADRGEILAGPAAGAAAGLPPAGFVRFGDAEVQLFRDPGE
jgi:pSer/pThr/pTyr-binding forkhead associated (FHA) protein